MDRRRFLANATAWAATLPAASLLTGCESFWRAVLESCPETSSESGDINWVPSVLHPVFYGYQDLTTADGAPGPVRIWYPTYEGFLPNPPILKMCVVRWPLVLFLHGMPPPTGGPPCDLPNYHHLWYSIPMTLARSGYVVVVPRHSALLPQDPLSSSDWPLTLLDWTRSSWEHARWVDQRPESTAVAGHSYGALLAGRVANARPQVAAYVGLSGPWSELNDVGNVLRNLDAPAFFMFNPDGLESLDSGGLWDLVATPKYAALYPGEHFDYIRDVADCAEARGGCSRFERAAADLVALFIFRHLPVPVATAHVPVNLDPSPVSQTFRQQFFSGGHLTGDGRLAGLTAFSADRACRIDLRWADGAVTGSRRIGS